ncbi:10716_t:CDS:2 [Rhizophagus irregularis]|nr:10716_t:CDS:2 [Rhizophagus irregularis]
MTSYNLFRAENPEFVKRSLRLVFNMYDNNLDSILLIFWFFAALLHSLQVGMICVMDLVVDTKSEDNSQQNDEEETVPLLNDDVDAELIDDDEINVRCIKADKKETEVDVIDVDVELIDDDEIDVKCIEADKKETEVDEVDAKLIKIDNSEGQHEV